VNSQRTVSTTKQAFFDAYSRPINSIYRRVIDELLVEAHLLVVNTDFRYDPLFANGLLTVYNTLMEGYRPADQREAILRAFVAALGFNLDQLEADAQPWRSLSLLPAQEVFEVMAGTREPSVGPLLAVRDTLVGIAQNPRFKYSRLFAVGLANIVEQVARAAGLSEKDRLERLQQVAGYLKIDFTRIKRDLDLYNSTIDRIRRSKEVVDELVAADRRKREERAASQSGG
jgi:photosystem II biogenesis protein Psp29